MNTVNLDEIKRNIPPQKYNEMLSGVELESILLKSFSAQMDRAANPGEIPLSFNEKAEITKFDCTLATIDMSYVLQGKQGRKTVFKVQATYEVTFRTGEQITRDFFELYNVYTLPLQTYPYFRELVDSTVAKMGLPTLLMPLRKNLVSNGKPPAKTRAAKSPTK